MWLKTPLHYASQRGSSICALYLQKRGANLEALDIYENTPLGVAMLSNHHHYAILMIQTKADVTKLVHPENYERIARMWKEEKLRELGEDVEMEDEHESKKKHRKLFDKQKDTNNVFYDSEYDDEDDSDSDEDDSDDQFERNQFN